MSVHTERLRLRLQQRSWMSQIPAAQNGTPIVSARSHGATATANCVKNRHKWPFILLWWANCDSGCSQIQSQSMGPVPILCDRYLRHPLLLIQSQSQALHVNEHSQLHHVVHSIDSLLNPCLTHFAVTDAPCKWALTGYLLITALFE